MTDNILVRIQAPCGTKRIETKSSDTTKIFFDKVQDVFDLSNTGWSIYKDRNKTGEIYTSRSKTMSTYHIRHGDMLYLMLTGRGGECKNKDERRESESSIGSGASLVVEDEVDIFLSKQDGRRHRPRDDKLCRHGALAKCIHCVPVEPYDETYLKNHSPPIKYMSFHAYLRKLTGGVDKGKFAALENISCKIKPGCKEHPPWPGGICTKCQPSAVTLNRQVYRHVDNIMFENPHLVERFLNFWRTSGYQRLGFLYGHYEHYKEVPLGIKATVQAIYEPAQLNSADSIELIPDDLSELIDGIARKLGLLKIGWIFTDLVADDIRKGTVKNLRNMDTYYLSAEECIMSGAFQIQHPNPCKLSPDGFFGSKFVTVVVTGDAQNQVHFEGYQVSNQCMALVRDDCLVPTKDAPELGFVKESSNEQYVPDVFYKDKDEYGNEVTQLARPLPVEYLITDIPTTTPVEPQFTFFSNGTIKPFCVLNRANIGEFQDFQALTSYMQNFPPDQFLEAMSDFHLLIYLATMDTLPLKDHMDDLLEAVRTKNRDLAHHWSKTEQWATIDQLMAAQGSSPPASRQVSYVGSTSTSASNLVPVAGPPWTCRHCTFINQFDRSVCDMCSLPK